MKSQDSVTSAFFLVREEGTEKRVEVNTPRNSVPPTTIGTQTLACQCPWQCME